MKWLRSQLAAGIVLALSLTPHTVATATEDLSGLIAELNQAWQQGRSKDIADRFDEALRIVPNDYRVHKAYGDFLTANRRNQEALAAYRRAAELAPNALDVHWAMWSLFDRMGDQNRAILGLQEVARLDPENPLARLRLAKALRNVDRLEESADSFRRATELDPDHLAYRLPYARALYDVLRYEQARREVETVLARAPKASPEAAAAQNLLGLVRGDSSDKGRRAVTNQNIAIPGVDMAMRGKRWALTRDKAWQLMRAERHTEAEPALREVLAIMPEDYKIHYDLGLTLMELGRYEEAIAAFRAGIRVSRFGEWYPDSLYRIGLCQVKLGRWQEAVSRFERVLEIQNWQKEEGYGMTFPDVNAVQAALDDARRRISASETTAVVPAAELTIELMRPRSETDPAPALDSSMPLPEAIPLPTQVAPLEVGYAQGWFRQMIPARGVVQDDLPTGLQEFIPIAPTDTFAPDDPEIIIVFTLTSVPSDEIILNTRWMAERAERELSNTLIGTDTAMLTLNDKSGYVRLKRPQDGWPIGVYRVDFYLGDQVDAYTHTAEARFRVVAAAQTR
ncbi:tetratricopeptide repeat protein [Nitrospira moscoviensis]|nr:tetratricopeptide repeat protein [Nitrospira moscoviensis]